MALTQSEYPLSDLQTDELSIARNFHENFVENHSRHFIGRQELIDRLNRAATYMSSHPVVIVGEPGSGKTSLVSAFVRKFGITYTDEFNVICHFVGAAP